MSKIFKEENKTLGFRKDVYKIEIDRHRERERK